MKGVGLSLEGLQWMREQQAAQRDWWSDYERLASVTCAVGCGPFSANVGREHQRRTGHAAVEAAA